jgi:hypothetical protein
MILIHWKVIILKDFINIYLCKINGNIPVMKNENDLKITFYIEI